MMLLPLIAAAALAVPPAKPVAAPVTPASVVAGAPEDAWQEVAPDRLLVMQIAGGRQVVIALAPEFAAAHVANIRRLAAAHWWDGTSINRVQDNYVTQWGDATEAKPLPAGILSPPRAYDRPARGLRVRVLPYPDSYAGAVGHAAGWPVARSGGRAWLPHCYGMVGVGRNLAPDTGTGAELYAVIGHAPRQLDRNIAVVGRVLSGMDVLAGLPRGTGALGFYADPVQRPVIERVRLASELPIAERPRWQIMATEHPAFAAWIRVRANRSDEFYERPAAALDICNALPPVRLRAAE